MSQRVEAFPALATSAISPEVNKAQVYSFNAALKVAIWLVVW